MVSDFKPNESYQFFLQEAPELLQELEDGVLSLRQDWNVAQLWDLLRVAHSIKGGAACAGLAHIQEVAHHLETAFKTIALSTEDLLLKAFDCLKLPILEEIQTGKCDPQVTLAKARQVWQELERNLQEQRKDLGKIARAEEESDITYLLFLEDVAKGLKHWETVLERDSTGEMLESLTVQAQILRGIGGIANLGGFVAIAETTLQALRLNPHEVKRIGQQALADFHWARQAVLNGDRQRGGIVSSTLLNFAETNVSPSRILPQEDDQSKGEARSNLTDPYLLTETEEDTTATSSFPISTRQDGERLSLLNTSIAELISLDNRILAQHQDREETLEISRRSFNRIKQQVINLYRWSNQFTSLNSATAIPTASKFASIQNTSFLKNSLESIVEEIAQLNETLNDLSFFGQQYQQILKQKQKTIKAVKANLLQTQMLSLGELFHQFYRVVRDLGVREGKEVQLDLQGQNTLIEKAILERLYDPLVHLVRNAFDHGIEKPLVRQAANKPLQGKIRIKAWNRGNHTYIAVEDDGKGLDLTNIRAKAVEMGHISAESAPYLDDQQLYKYIFEPNFSTASGLSQLSGRGMGLYAVRSQILALKGTVTVQSEIGRGSTFLLKLPLTSTITKLLVFRVGRHLFALPVHTLAAITMAGNLVARDRQDRQFYDWKGDFVPIIFLSATVTYNYPLSSSSQEELERQEAEAMTKKFPLLLIARRSQIVALRIDEVLLEQDLVVKPFNNLAFNLPQNLMGCAILGDGRLVPVLDSVTLVEKWGRTIQNQPITIAERNLTQDVVVPALPTILIVDDSLTMRNAVSSTLRKAGYRVLQAKDGWEAWNLWQQEPQIVAIICDIEMPRMTGLELLSRCRQQDRSIPIVMLTYRSGQRYRQLAQELGASAYLTKPYLDRELLGILESYLG
jgi:two-component system, chemotaxis family, sensor histidine kinase and response regulator PixL